MFYSRYLEGSCRYATQATLAFSHVPQVAALAASCTTQSTHTFFKNCRALCHSPTCTALVYVFHKSIHTKQITEKLFSLAGNVPSHSLCSNPTLPQIHLVKSMSNPKKNLNTKDSNLNTQDFHQDTCKTIRRVVHSQTLQHQSKLNFFLQGTVQINQPVL